MTMNRRHLLATAAAGLALPWSASGLAQAWPVRPIRLISPYGAGGSNDILTRVLGDFLARRLGQGVVVENKAGAGTRIANDFVAKAPADGYTLLHAAAPIAIGEALYKDLPYDVHKSFASIASTAIAPLFLVVNAEAPYKSLAEFIKHAKSDPKGATFGSPGAGSAPHLTAELLLRASGAKGIVVQYRGDAAAYTELLAGRIDATLTAISTAIPHIQAGKLRVLGVATEERTPLYPQAPTIREQGLPSVVGYGWYGMLAPAGTPASIVAQLTAEINAAVADADVRRKAEAAGLQLRGSSSEDFSVFIASETRKWAQIIKTANITAE
ncbi:tripartite-type tricarboxylate transporter receptor subunit TctC [Variovorax boronicumulans]|uniref:Tripartite-type tricarboxylate transporter receptor subunit TctC n=1 Tax=Variovorax boronicumulans TaxID=436515 RepID=A0AAW8D4D0_9BURK|nr:tripartite tricarboxylate transporter substrate binding protein [Variovorax boronicumulans]MDP9896286.1 tripartite-type tricarboxylate transporter receptor subunit TctC [Variovorax boronicumulans]MDQ0056404.1 tripartite-type tricarboxylate transporter receptor subunit TctC [Variovorax boronicumulans]